jgi:GNAT superfamily N-acetyltransferase
MLSAMPIRPYEPARDEAAVLALWEACLGDTWPIEATAFRRTLGEGLVAVERGRPLGFAGFEAEGERGGLQVVLVAPTARRRGLGRALHDAALAAMAARGVGTVRLGPGPNGYLWPGVPVDLPEAWSFFAALGWRSDERASDLVLDLADYATPPWVLARLPPGVSVGPAAPGDALLVGSFEQAHLPGWERPFARPFDSGEPGDVLLARRTDGEILGSILLLDPRSRWHGPLTWSRRLGDLTGGPAVVGVAPDARDQGIGLALVARATELLRERRLARSCVIWTWLVDWYAKLGYRVWAEYRVSARRLD